LGGVVLPKELRQLNFFFFWWHFFFFLFFSFFLLFSSFFIQPRVFFSLFIFLTFLFIIIAVVIESFFFLLFLHLFFVFLILDPSFFVQGLVPFFVISRVIFRHLFFFVPFVFKFVSISWQFVLSHHISSLFFIFLLSNFHDILPTSLYIR